MQAVPPLRSADWCARRLSACVHRGSGENKCVARARVCVSPPRTKATRPPHAHTHAHSNGPAVEVCGGGREIQQVLG